MDNIAPEQRDVKPSPDQIPDDVPFYVDREGQAHVCVPGEPQPAKAKAPARQGRVVEVTTSISLAGGRYYVEGDTYEVRDQLKKDGFRFDGEKRMWFTTSKRAAAKWGELPEEQPADEDSKPSIELLFTRHMLSDPNIRVGGPTGDADGRIDRTVYRWQVDNDGTAYWRIIDPGMLKSEAQRFIEHARASKYTDRCAESCAETLTTALVGGQQEKWVPRADAKRNLIPLRGQYLAIREDGTIACVAPDPSHGVTYCVNASYDPKKVKNGIYQPQPVPADSHFGRYLATTFADDDVRNLAQEAFATVLINRCFEKSVWMYGEGENGKSVMLHIMTAVVGGRSAPVKLARLTRDHFGTAALHGARLATVAEVPKALTNEMQDLLKELISWDAQPLERKGRDAFTFRPNAVWLLASNAFPRVSQHEHGFWRKILTLPFTQRVKAENKIQDFHKLITDDAREMSIVIDWLLIGAQRLIKRGGKFGELPQAVAALAQQQRMESDPVVAFLDDTEALVDETIWTSKIAVYHAYREYCEDRGKQPLNESNFWVGVRGAFNGADMEGRRGPAGANGKRERYVQLRLEGVTPLPRGKVPPSWMGQALAEKAVKAVAEKAPAPVQMVESTLDDAEWVKQMEEVEKLF